jgi:hypothetical protein
VLACNLPSSAMAGRPLTRISYFLSAAKSLGIVNSSSNRYPDRMCVLCGRPPLVPSLALLLTVYAES